MDAQPNPQADIVVDAFRAGLFRGDGALQSLPGLLKRILREELWRDRVIYKTGERAQFHDFAEFVCTAPLDGLGADIDLVRRMVAVDTEATDLLDRALQRPHGGKRAPKFDNVQLATEAVGNSRAAALRRLRKDRPDLHARVVADELSPHAAMIEAGFRKRTTPLDSLRHWWAKATATEREQFLNEIMP